MKKGEKRGISTIIVTIILIGLSLAAIVIVWAVISNILKSGTQQVSFQYGTMFLSLKIEKVTIDSSTGNVSVTISRDAGQGDLTGVAFVFSDGKNTKVIKKITNMTELESQTFTFTSDDLGSISIVKEIDIAPIVGGQVGKEVGNQIFSTKQILQNLGAVSWWKLDGNANDEISENNGNIIGNVNFVEGKYGKAANFDGSSGYISVADSNNLDVINQITIMFWFNVNSYTGNHTILIGKRNDSEKINKENYGLGFTNGSNFIKWWTINNTGGFTDVLYNQIISTKTWYNLAVTQDDISQKINFYVEGNLVQTNSTTNTLKLTSGNLGIGAINTGNGPSEFFNGSIEDIIIFNRALTAQQIKSLSQFDLTSS